ncbi:MAG: methyltransferase domain-containing protein [Myxococcales bacterium]|nr:methyltransferase domain-containing protein [Myxococcales bacterium]MCB9694277.1 methyltransferase domain-containing protein [Alphaproteobacteria bacterium]
MDRRTFLLHTLAAAFLAACGSAELPAPPASPIVADPGSDFHAIYDDPQLRERFLLFLTNVFHLYPEDELHRLVEAATKANASDEAIYAAVVAGLPSITPTASTVRYALPALQKQKAVMAHQTATLLGEGTIDGYLEIGTVGRYRNALSKRVTLEGPSFVVHDREPGKDLSDVVERGTVGDAGTFVDLAGYAPIGDAVPDASIGLVTNYIGFHHCPDGALEGFVGSIRRVLRPGGRLVLREHDVNRPVMRSLVALAHDVFNAGTGLTWAENHAEIRGFRSVADWVTHLGAHGFRRLPGEQRQEGDPTDNVLLVLERV